MHLMMFRTMIQILINILNTTAAYSEIVTEYSRIDFKPNRSLIQ